MFHSLDSANAPPPPSTSSTASAIQRETFACHRPTERMREGQADSAKAKKRDIETTASLGSNGLLPIWSPCENHKVYHKDPLLGVPKGNENYLVDHLTPSASDIPLLRRLRIQGADDRIQ